MWPPPLPLPPLPPCSPARRTPCRSLCRAARPSSPSSCLTSRASTPTTPSRSCPTRRASASCSTFRRSCGGGGTEERARKSLHTHSVTLLCRSASSPLRPTCTTTSRPSSTRASRRATSSATRSPTLRRAATPSRACLTRGRPCTGGQPHSSLLLLHRLLRGLRCPRSLAQRRVRGPPLVGHRSAHCAPQRRPVGGAARRRVCGGGRRGAGARRHLPRRRGLGRVVLRRGHAARAGALDAGRRLGG